MTTLNNIISVQQQTEQAIAHGTQVHARLQKITQFDINNPTDTISHTISANTDLHKFFCPASQTEVPIAGTINGHFISRRIDRMYIDHNTKNIYILDYKTDTNPDERRQQYIHQIHEYINLVHKTHPNYTVSGYILWTHDFSLERI